MMNRFVYRKIYVIFVLFICGSFFMLLKSLNFAEDLEKTPSPLQVEARESNEIFKDQEIPYDEDIPSREEFSNKTKHFIENTADVVLNAIKNSSESLVSVTEQTDTRLKEENVIGVLVIVCNRPNATKRSLGLLFQYRPSGSQFPIIVSQDCGSHNDTTNVLRVLSESYNFTHIMQPDQSTMTVLKTHEEYMGYYKIARHYGFALNYTFNVLKLPNVIVVEDDLDVAPDFYEYFAATLPILKNDTSIWCVSAWNDNGKLDHINESANNLLYRSDFFPGLGWMIQKSLWEELMTKWPSKTGFWDDWMREPAQRKDRVCIRPEISRTKTFGKIGVSLGVYFEAHLKFIKLNEDFVPFSKLDLSYLLKDNYDGDFVQRVYSSQYVETVKELKSIISQNSSVQNEFRITYTSQHQFVSHANQFGIMNDFKAGCPRTAYRGVVSFMYKNRRVYLAPAANWTSYQDILE